MGETPQVWWELAAMCTKRFAGGTVGALFSGFSGTVMVGRAGTW